MLLRRNVLYQLNSTLYTYIQSCIIISFLIYKSFCRRKSSNRLSKINFQIEIYDKIATPQFRLTIQNLQPLGTRWDYSDSPHRVNTLTAHIIAMFTQQAIYRRRQIRHHRDGVHFADYKYFLHRINWTTALTFALTRALKKFIVRVRVVLCGKYIYVCTYVQWFFWRRVLYDSSRACISMGSSPYLLWFCIEFVCNIHF